MFYFKTFSRLLTCLPGTESFTIPIHFFPRASELEAAFKQSSVPLPTPHPTAGFAGEVIALLKSLNGCLGLFGHISNAL